MRPRHDVTGCACRPASDLRSSPAWVSVRTSRPSRLLVMHPLLPDREAEASPIWEEGASLPNRPCVGRRPGRVLCRFGDQRTGHPGFPWVMGAGPGIAAGLRPGPSPTRNGLQASPQPSRPAGWVVRRRDGKRQPLPLLDLGGASRRTVGAVTERSEGEGASDLDSPAAGATMIEVQGGRARRAAALAGRSTHGKPGRTQRTGTSTEHPAKSGRSPTAGRPTPPLRSRATGRRVIPARRAS